MNQLPLADLDAFAAVAAARSFRKTARLRAVSASALSEAVRRLESQLEIRLFNRTTRSVTLTDAGERLLERLRPGLAGIEAALEAVHEQGDEPAGRLRLNVPGIVAREVLPPLACRFLADHPRVSMEVTTNDALIDVLAEGFDAGVRYEEALHQDMIAIPIGPPRQRSMTAASSDYLSRRGVPAVPAELMRHDCILHRFDSGRIVPWEFQEDGREIALHPAGRIISSNVDMELAAAIAGIGIVHTFEEFLAPAIADGRLIPILCEYDLWFSGPFLYYPSRAFMPGPLRAFVDFIKADNRDRERRLRHNGEAD